MTQVVIFFLIFLLPNCLSVLPEYAHLKSNRSEWKKKDLNEIVMVMVMVVMLAVMMAIIVLHLMMLNINRYKLYYQLHSSDDIIPTEVMPCVFVCL